MMMARSRLKEQFVKAVEPEEGKELIAVAIGKKLAKIRERTGLNADELGKTLHSSRDLISSIEDGRLMPTKRFMGMLLDTLMRNPKTGRISQNMGRALADERLFLIGHAAPDIVPQASISAITQPDTIPGLQNGAKKVSKTVSAVVLGLLMEEHGISAAELSELTGVEKTRIERILSGAAILTENILNRIGEGMGLEPEAIDVLLKSVMDDRYMKDMKSMIRSKAPAR